MPASKCRHVKKAIDPGTRTNRPVVFGLAIVAPAAIVVAAAVGALIVHNPWRRTDDNAIRSAVASAEVNTAHHEAGRDSVETPVLLALGKDPPLPGDDAATTKQSPAIVASATMNVASRPAETDRRFSPLRNEVRFGPPRSHSAAELMGLLLAASHEVDIETEKGGKVTKELLQTGRKPGKLEKGSGSESPAVFDVIAKRDDLRGLPVRDLSECQAPRQEAEAKNTLSQAVRRNPKLAVGRINDTDPYVRLKIENEAKKYVKNTSWPDEAGPAMAAQMFLILRTDVRAEVAKSVAANRGRAATETLARIAVFDLNADVRALATTLLKDRPAVEWRPTLVKALRYPWSPAAEHAAVALVALKDRDSAGQLVSLLDQPDPSAPVKDADGHWHAAEMVRVNHLGNCLLCHAPSHSENDPMRAGLPDRSEPLPGQYYSGPARDFVRADITYIKQDFSVLQFTGYSPLADFREYLEKPSDNDPPKASHWPSMQRFDYMVRLRPITEDEAGRLSAEKETEDEGGYSQRRAVLWALCELTGENLGSRSEDWRGLLESTNGKERR
jgi:hypothetical protein